MCGEPASQESFSVHVHRALLKGMQADRSLWWYRIDGSNQVVSLIGAMRSRDLAACFTQVQR